MSSFGGSAHDDASEGLPRRAIMHCPFCNVRHVDEGKWAERLHHKHLCLSCGKMWRVEPYCFGVSEDVSEKPADGLIERVVAHSLRVVAKDVELGKTPPMQVAALLVNAANTIDRLKAELSPGYRPSTSLNGVQCPACEETSDAEVDALGKDGGT